MRSFQLHLAAFCVGCLTATHGLATPLKESAKSVTSELTAVARSLEGTLVVGGATFYRISRVLSIDEQEDGIATLHAEADPLFEGQYSGNPDGNTGGRLYYNVRIDPKAPCGLPSVGTDLNTSNFLVFRRGEFVTFGEAFPNIPIRSWDRPINRVTKETLTKLNQCAKQLSEVADAKPFRRIGIYSGRQRITGVARTFTSSSTYEEGPGDELIMNMTHLTIIPRGNASLSDFEIRVRAVSVMHCDYEGPHLELDNWKQGVGPEVPLQRVGNKFVVGQDTLASRMPSFPAYTKTELRRAIAQQLGIAGLASSEEAKPCAPFLRGYRFFVRYRSELVQEIFVAFAGGC